MLFGVWAPSDGAGVARGCCGVSRNLFAGNPGSGSKELGFAGDSGSATQVYNDNIGQNHQVQAEAYKEQKRT
jgi:hypothetical protein